MYRTSGPPTYQLRPGDTLYSVARKRGIAPADLMAMNPDINPYGVRPGTVLRLPAEPAVVASAAAQPSAAAPSALRDEMRTLWEQHIWWTRELITSIASDLPDESDVEARLMRNPAQIAALFGPTFGAAAQQAVAQLLTEHLSIGGEVIHATQDGDAAALADADRRWHQNADAIASALAGLGPQFNREAMQRMLYRHLDLTKRGAAYRIAGDYPADIATSDEIERQALMMADELARGIAQG